MADNTFTGMNIPAPAPPDPYGTLEPGQWAGQGVEGPRVARPTMPGTPADYPVDLTGGGNASYQPPPAQSQQSTFLPRQPGESGLEFFARKEAAGEQFTPGDFLALAAEQQKLQAALGAGAGGVTSTTTSTTKQNDSPELRELRSIRSRALLAYGERMLQTANAAEQAGVQQADLHLQRAEQLKAETFLEQQKRQDQTEQLQRLQTAADQASKDYVKAGQEIDPNRYMRGGRGVLAALAMAAGAYGATLGRTQNFAQQIIDAAIDRDLSAQKMALNVKRDALTQVQQSFQNYRAIFQDDAAARAAVRADAREVYAAKLGAVASRFNGKEQQANIMNQRDQLLLENNTLRQQQAEMLAGRVQRSTTTQSGPAVGAGGGDIMETMAKAAANAKAFNELNASAGPGNSDKALYNEIATTAADYATAVKLGAQVKTLLDKTDGLLGGAVERGTGLTKDSKTLATARGQLRIALINASSGKAFTDAERQEIRAMLEEGAWGNEGLRQKLEQVQNYMGSKIQSQISVLHPNLRDELYQRMRGGGVQKNVLESMFTGTAAQNNSERGANLGARSY